MSHKRGAKLNGIRSLEDLRQRCSIDEASGCWHWSLSMCEGYPRVWLPPDVVGERRGRLTGSLAAYFLSNGAWPSDGKKVYRTCLCNDCVNPVHVKAWTRAEHGTWMSLKGAWKGQPKRIIANRATKRKTAKLSLEKAREIRASSETQVALGKRYGVSQSVIGGVKSGRLWQEHAPNASVFGWAA